jgi:hypothetical protein
MCPAVQLGAKENFRGGGGAEVVAGAAVPGQAVRPLLAVRRTPAAARNRADRQPTD